MGGYTSGLVPDKHRIDAAATESGEAGSILINEVKNIVITVIAATAVIGGSLSFGYDVGYTVYYRAVERSGGTVRAVSL